MASIDLQTLNKHLESIKKKHADRVNILKVTNAQLHATITGLKLAEEDSRNLVHVRNIEIETLKADKERLIRQQQSQNNNNSGNEETTNNNSIDEPSYIIIALFWS